MSHQGAQEIKMEIPHPEPPESHEAGNGNAASENEQILQPQKDDINYTGLLKLIFKPGETVLSPEFMNDHDIQPGNQVAIMDGKDFDARKFGYTKMVADSDQFIFYFVKKSYNLKKQYKIFECCYKNEKGERACTKVIHGITKFFCHLMTHTKQKPHRCTYANCSASFCQIGNLRKHLETHEGIKNFECEHCHRLYSKKYNLKMH